MEASPHGLVVTASSGTIRRAAGLLDAVFDELVDPARWCKGAYVCGPAGEMIEGPLLAAIESPQAASRCLFSSLVHQGLVRGFRIELEPEAEKDGRAAEVTRAPATWLLAAIVLTSIALDTLDSRGLLPEPATGDDEHKPVRPGQLIVSSTIVFNDDCDYEDVIWAAALAPELLRGELDRRARSTL